MTISAKLAKSPNRRPFSSMTNLAASRLAVGLAKLASMGCRGLVLQGAWLRRRFVIESGHEPDKLVSEVDFDVENLSMSLPLGCDAETIVRECRRFGGHVERSFRDKFAGQFDHAVAVGGGEFHLVHRFHHVALCGFSGPWATQGPGSIDDTEVCDRCQSVAVTKPVHRARYHPLCTPRLS